MSGEKQQIEPGTVVEAMILSELQHIRQDLDEVKTRMNNNNLETRMAVNEAETANNKRAICAAIGLALSSFVGLITLVISYLLMK